MDHAEPVEQVFAEQALLRQAAQVAVGGGDDPGVDQDGFVGADTLDLVRLQHPQQLDLAGQRQFADLVEENRAGVGAFELALAVVGGAGEGALLVTEQFRLQQVVGDRAAIDRDERAVGAAAVGVDDLGHQLLASAALTVDQHRQVGRRRLLGDFQGFEQARIVAEGTFEDEAAVQQRLAAAAQ